MKIPSALSEPEYCKGSVRVPRVIGGLLAALFVTALASTSSANGRTPRAVGMGRILPATSRAPRRRVGGAR